MTGDVDNHLERKGLHMWRASGRQNQSARLTWVGNLLGLIIVLRCGLGDVTSVYGQRVHAVIAGDTSPWAAWGKYEPNITLDMTMMYSVLHSQLPEHQLEYHSLMMSTDEESSPQTVMQLLDEVMVEPNDTLFFYFTGHGAQDDRGHHLALAQGALYRAELLPYLQGKGARLTVVMTDCCNVRSDGKLQIFPAPYAERPAQVTPVFRSLFMEPRGVVDICSSSPGESAFFAVDPESPGGIAGSLFTRSLAAWFDDWQNQTSTWDNLLRGVSLRVHIAFRESYPHGSQITKGAARQADQNVFAIAYPGMPERSGPRTGLQVRDESARGALIVNVNPDSPAARAYDLSAKRSQALRAGQVIIEANGQPIHGAQDFMSVTQKSPQVMRLTVQDPRAGQRIFLMRLRY